MIVDISFFRMSDKLGLIETIHKETTSKSGRRVVECNQNFHAVVQEAWGICLIGCLCYVIQSFDNMPLFSKESILL